MDKGKSVLATDSDGKTIQAASLHTALTQSVSVSGVSAATGNAVGSIIVRLMSTTACFVRADVAGGTALVTDLPLAANVPEYFTLNPGQYVIAITSGGSGTLYVTEC
jgi:hypothetical protein